jgi:L-threonylcarbamoyladenylate synthase
MKKYNSGNIFDIDEQPEVSLTSAVDLYHSGKIFIYPTDTIYGIGGNPFDKKVVQRVSKIKGRDDEKKFIWLISDLNKLFDYVDIGNENHINFLQRIWPGSVSVILNLNKRTSENVNMDTVAIRIPYNQFCNKFLTEIRQPLISTSVNLSGQEPLDSVEMIIEKFSSLVDAVYYTREQLPRTYSTIIDLTASEPKLIREGSIKFVELLNHFS